MAKLQKLQISGIRSFGPYEHQCQQLKFQSPLTLILGQNGCGKTTIIESIRFACSGELPSGAQSGQGFVNDPKMSKNTTTKGQIKLKIIDAKGNEVTVCRVVEVIQKGAVLSFSTKSTSLRTLKPNGQEASTSGRCADVTTECCQIMNVSASVLNNVIFCHQENSSWPLDEGKKLKEKFDDIFDAERYNRCADLIRKQIKIKEAKVKVMTVELKFQEEKKEDVERDKRRLEEKTAQIEAMATDIATKIEEIRVIETRIKEISKLENELGDLQRQQGIKEQNKKGVLDIQKNITDRAGFEEYEGDDESLRQDIQSFEAKRATEKDQIDKLEAKKIEIEKKIKTLAADLMEAQRTIARYNQEKDQYTKQCAERKNKITECQALLKVPSGGLHELQTALKHSQTIFDQLLATNEAQEAQLQKNIDSARENLATAKQSITTTNAEIYDAQKKVQKINNDLTTLAGSDAYLKEVSDKLEDIDRTIRAVTQKFTQSEESQKGEAARRDLKAKEQTLEALEIESRILRENDITEGKMETEKNLIMSKQKAIGLIKNKNAEGLTELFDRRVPGKGLKSAVATLQNQEEGNLKRLNEKIAAKQREVTTLETQRKHQFEKVKNCEAEINTKKAKIAEVCASADSADDFETTMRNSYMKKERLQRDKGQYSSVKIIYEQFLREFEKQSPCCPVCETDFTQKTSNVRKIVATIKSKICKVPMQLVKVEEDLSREEQLYTRLQQLSLVNEEIEALTNALPLKKDDLNTLEEKLKAGKRDLGLLENEILKPQRKIQLARNMIPDITSLEHNQADIDRAQKTIDYLKEQIVTGESNKSKQEIDMEIDELKSEISELRQRIEAQTKKINNHRVTMQQLNEEKGTLLTKQMNLKEGIQGRPLLETQQKELTTKTLQLEEDIEHLIASKTLLEAELQEATREKNALVDENKALVQQERDKMTQRRSLLSDLEKLQKAIDDYITGRVEQKLLDAEAEFNALKTKVSDFDKTKEKIAELVSKKKEQLCKQDLGFSNLQDNELLRKQTLVVRSLDEEIRALRHRIGEYDYGTVYDEKRILLVDNEKLSTERSRLQGEQTAVTNEIRELKVKLARPENKNAYTDYMNKYYEMELTSNVIDDLNKYIVALEKGVLDFHKSKMNQINKTIREMWREVYRGNDIDYIEIKTEYASGNARKRAYNYKVVQVKKGIELDMRGRCSAGQKVLCCLIIRMALAEILSANCGILALDEPTTNLDRENILSLSDTLSRIVNSRQQDKNFQLIVITHDEEFLNTLNRVQGISSYYRVSRDNEGFSVITKEHAF